MTNEQMKEATIRDLFERSRGGDNEAAGILLGYFQQEEHIKTANEFAAKKASEMIAQMGGSKIGGMSAEEYNRRCKELGIDA